MKPSQVTRRQFGQAVGLAAGLTFVPAAAAQQAEPADTVQALTEALSGVVRARYGQFLTDAQMLEVEKAIARKQRNARLMRQVTLKNSDEPAFVFRADV